MPAIVTCAGCGHILMDFGFKIGKYNPANYGNTKPWFETLHRDLKGQCPNCKRQLPQPRHYVESMTVKVTAMETQK